MCVIWPCFCKQWFSLRDAPSGSVHLRLEWLSLLPSADRLPEVSPQHSLVVLRSSAMGFTKYCTNIHICASYCFRLSFRYQVIQKNQNLTSKTGDPPSAAILAVYLDQAYELPVRAMKKCLKHGEGSY